jgi:hypothetical protein
MEVDGLPAGQIGPERHVAGNVGDPPVQRHRVPPGVAAEQPHGARFGAQQTQQHPDRGGLARAIGAEESADVAVRDGQVQPVQCLGASETLCQAVDFHRQGVR